MPHRSALVDHLYAVLFEMVNVLLRLVACCLDNLDAAFDDRLTILGIGRRGNRRQDGQVHAEGLVGHVLRALDFLRKVFRRRLCQRGQETECARFGNRGNHFGIADPLHAALNNRVLDTEHLGETCLDMHLSCLPLPPTAVRFCVS